MPKADERGAFTATTRRAVTGALLTTLLEFGTWQRKADLTEALAAPVSLGIEQSAIAMGKAKPHASPDRAY